MCVCVCVCVCVFVCVFMYNGAYKIRTAHYTINVRMRPLYICTRNMLYIAPIPYKILGSF